MTTAAVIDPARLAACAFPGERRVTPEVVREHNLNQFEYDKILGLLGRAPTLTELGVFSALWSPTSSLIPPSVLHRSSFQYS